MAHLDSWGTLLGFDLWGKYIKNQIKIEKINGYSTAPLTLRGARKKTHRGTTFGFGLPILF